MFKKKIKELFEGGPTGLIGFIAGLLLLLMALSWLIDGSTEARLLSHSEFCKAIEDDSIEKVKIAGDQVYGKFKNNERFEGTVHMTDTIWKSLEDKKVEVIIIGTKQSLDPWMIIGALVAIAFIVGLWLLLRKSKNSNGSSSLFSFGKSRFKKIGPGQLTTRFSDVAGAQNAKNALSDVINFLKDPERFKKMGARIPKGVLLSGEPGNGKTLLARAVAGEAQCSFLSISGADFIEVFVGVGASRIRDLFSQARKSAPCILFIDEIDAIGRSRGSGFGGGHDEREQTLNQLLTEMDGFDQYELPLVVLAATNIPEVLDKALLRPGRFDRIVNVPYPDQTARLELLKIHTSKIPIDSAIDLEFWASQTQGLSGADIENLINIAALKASQTQRGSITNDDFMEAHKDIMNNKRDMQASGKHETKEFMPQQVKTKFSDVAGNEEAKEDVKEIVDFLKNPFKYKKMGARIPRGVLMYGDPGNGKTLLARAIAGEAGVPFFYASGSQFIQKYVGVGAQRIRELFSQARKNAPAIIFIDEIDAIGKRVDEEGGGSSEHNQTINQLLTEMDGFIEADNPVIVIAATNRKAVLDKALLRPGRFDRHVHIDYPNLKARYEILQVHARGKSFNQDVNLEHIAKATTGFSGASLEALLNEAAILSASRSKELIGYAEIEEARDRIIMGKKNSGLNRTKKDLEQTAWHEAGHIVTALMQNTFPKFVHKVTILSRGGSLGSAHYIPQGDITSYSKENLEANIIVSLGGRAAEEIVFRLISTGASGDFQSATESARRMVMMYGMGEKTGLISYDEVRYLSQETLREIDQEVKKIVDRCYQQSIAILTQNRSTMDAIAEALLKKEELTAQEIYEIAGIPMPQDYFLLPVGGTQ